MIRAVNGGASRDQRLDHIDLALKRRRREGGDARAGRQIHVGAAGQRLLDVVERSREHRADEWGLGGRISLIRPTRGQLLGLAG